MDFIVENVNLIIIVAILCVLIISILINVICISKLKTLCCKQRICLKESKDLISASKRIESMFDSINQRVKFMSSVLKAKRKVSKENYKKRITQNKKPYKVSMSSMYGSYGNNRKSSGYSNNRKPKSDERRSYDRREHESSVQVTV